MIRTTCLVLSGAALCATAFAQSNQRGPGYNAALTNAYSATDWGRRGVYPNGQVAVSFANQLCNPGSINVNWYSPGGSIGASIQSDHPKFGFLVARELDGRLVQISDWSYCKHAFFALSSASVCGGTCQPTSGNQLGVSCSDIYSNGNNASRNYLGPPAEIDPWLGTWNPIGSYFDIGQPLQAGYPLPADQIYSLSTTGYDALEKRVILPEALVPVGQDMFFQILVIVEGERVENRANNIGTNSFRMTIVNPTATGNSAWSTVTTGSMQQNTILHRWAGATVTTGSNGGTGTYFDADGRFDVAVKVTGPTNGRWHYEYCVMNRDNSRGGGAFRVPVCPSARVENIGFRDIDQDPLNDWPATVSGGEIAWLATASNAHNWNTLYNFWFDCDVAPTAGNVVIDQARPGPGAATVTVATTVPGLQPSVWLGAGCGTPATELQVNGVPSAGNGAFAVEIAGAPATFVALFYSNPAVPTSLGSGCDLFLDGSAFGTVGLYVTDGSGLASVAMPVLPTQTPADLVFQGASFVPSPPLFGLFGLTNGLKVRFASTGCE